MALPVVLIWVGNDVHPEACQDMVSLSEQTAKKYS